MGVKYRLFGVGLKGKSPTVSSQHRINCYIERVIDEDTEQTSIIASPGMDLMGNLGDTPIRGWIVVEELIYAVHRDTFWEINNGGVATSRGTISTSTGRVDLASDGDVILITDGTQGYTYTISSTTLAAIGDADFPDTATTCSWGGGYFKVETGDQWMISEDGTTWDPLDIATAEHAPDGIVRVFDDHSEALIFGDYTTEFWGLTGNADFPYLPIRGSSAEYGLAAKWSLSKFENSVAGLFKNRLGQVQVMMIEGHTMVPISTPELDSIINRYTNPITATGYAYMHEGHSFYRINFPSDGKSWEYDGTASKQLGSPVWCERQSGVNGERHRGEICVNYLNKVRVSDYENGKFYTLNATSYDENDVYYPFEITSRRLVRDFDPFTVNKVFLDFETGVGLNTGQGSDPQVMLSISRDGGRTFGQEMWKDLGAVGKYLTRVEWHQIGTADSFVFKVRITDPVKRHLLNAGLIE
jgi:hypothetical protein